MIKRGRCPSSSSKLDRKIVEKNRRILMKGLCAKLASLLPSQHHFNSSKEIFTLPDQLDHSIAYIKQLQERIEELNDRKKKLHMSAAGIRDQMKDNTTVLELKDLGSCVDVNLITEVNKNFSFHEAISVIEQEGAEVVNANVSTVGNKVYHTIHAKVKSSRVGVEISSIRERLKELIY